MSDGYKVHLIRCFPKDRVEGESAENSPAGTEIELRKLLGICADSCNNSIQFIQKQLRRSQTALRVPFDRSCSFFERIRVNGC
jgi:hypothetical protein